MPLEQERGVQRAYLLDLDDSHHQRYQLLLSFNYLEHQPDAHAFLTRCHQLLSDDGQLLLTVPNLDFLLASESGHEFVTDHLVYFTVNSLETALRLTGFVVEEIQVINNQYDIQVRASKRPPARLAASKAAVLHLVGELNARLHSLRQAGKKIAVWGAGHRTLALLSLCDFSNIECIIDSAKFKHGKLAPLSHLPIRPPEWLLEPDCDIDVILVMVPGIYPKEVLKRIAELPRPFAAEEFPPPHPSPL